MWNTLVNSSPISFKLKKDHINGTEEKNKKLRSLQAGSVNTGKELGFKDQPK